MRVTLDRTAPLYKSVYSQRTSVERINSQTKTLGIGRPKVRYHCSMERLNTLTYILIDVRAVVRATSIKKGLLQMN
jgi:hypothetical protein